MFPLCTWDKFLPNPTQRGKKSRKTRMWIFPLPCPTSESGEPLCHGGSQTWLQHLAVFSSSKLGLASEVFFLRTMGASHWELKGMESLSSPTGNLNPNSGVTKIDSLQLWNNFLSWTEGRKAQGVPVYFEEPKFLLYLEIFIWSAALRYEEDYTPPFLVLRTSINNPFSNNAVPPSVLVYR